MALLHDLAEAVTGDLTPREKRRRGLAYQTEEEKAVDRLLSRLPGDAAASYRALWYELREALSPEAELVARADKAEMLLQASAEMLLQASEYEEKGVDPARLERFWHSMVGDGLASELLREIRRRKRVD
jgi:5'-deoxynucleotidase YfbR-like HD superfamily hydrolase